MRLDPSHSRLAITFAFVALFALTGPGAIVAYAGTDLAPSADQLFGPGAGPAKPDAVVACDPTRARVAAASRRQAAARLAQLMGGAGNGAGRSLRNGMGYQAQRDPIAQLQRIEAEAAAQRASQH